jgi:hypothetical protein
MPPRKRTTSIAGGDIAGLDVSMLRCRTYGHAWDEFYPDNLGIPMYGWRLSLRCTRCSTERHDVINVRGEVGQRRYLYPDGYQRGRDEQLTREQFRLHLFANVRDKLAKAAAINERIGAA